MASLPQNLKAAVHELERQLRRLYGDRFERLLLYGSHARGQATAGSDVDLLLLLHGKVDPVKEVLRVSPLKWPLALANEVVLSVMPVSAEAFASSSEVLLSTARQEAVAVA
jgi:uncharacterized protein